MWLDLTESVKAMRRMTQVPAWKSNPAFWLMTTTSVLPWVSGYWHAQQIWNYYEEFPEVNEWMSLWLLVPWRTSLHLQRPYSQIRSHDIHRSPGGRGFQRSTDMADTRVLVFKACCLHLAVASPGSLKKMQPPPPPKLLLDLLNQNLYFNRFRQFMCAKHWTA